MHSYVHNLMRSKRLITLLKLKLDQKSLRFQKVTSANFKIWKLFLFLTTSYYLLTFARIMSVTVTFCASKKRIVASTTSAHVFQE